MITAYSILLEKYEGKRGRRLLRVDGGYDVWEKAAEVLREWSKDCPKGGGYDKTEMIVSFEDGFQYKTRLDVKHFSEPNNDTDPAKAIRLEWEFNSGRIDVNIYPEDQRDGVREYIAELDAEYKEGFGQMLDTYQVGPPAPSVAAA